MRVRSTLCVTPTDPLGPRTTVPVKITVYVPVGVFRLVEIVTVGAALTDGVSPA